jgi:hypothetical protein
VGRRFDARLRQFAAAPSLADPDVHFGHIADAARLNDLHHAAVVVARVNLRPHLGGDALFLAASASIRDSSNTVWVSGFSQ